MSPRWRVFRVGVPLSPVGTFWVAQQPTTNRSEAFTTFSEAVGFAQAAARESWGYRA